MVSIYEQRVTCPKLKTFCKYCSVDMTLDEIRDHQEMCIGAKMAKSKLASHDVPSLENIQLPPDSVAGDLINLASKMSNMAISTISAYVLECSTSDFLVHFLNPEFSWTVPDGAATEIQKWLRLPPLSNQGAGWGESSWHCQWMPGTAPSPTVETTVSAQMENFSFGKESWILAFFFSGKTPCANTFPRSLWPQKTKSNVSFKATLSIEKLSWRWTWSPVQPLATLELPHRRPNRESWLMESNP